MKNDMLGAQLPTYVAPYWLTVWREIPPQISDGVRAWLRQYADDEGDMGELARSNVLRLNAIQREHSPER